MLKTEIKYYDENGTCPCKACKRKKRIRYPRINLIDGLYYAQCTNCGNFGLYDFIGLSRKAAINNWNNRMEHNDNEY